MLGEADSVVEMSFFVGREKEVSRSYIVPQGQERTAVIDGRQGSRRHAYFFGLDSGGTIPFAR